MIDGVMSVIISRLVYPFAEIAAARVLSNLSFIRNMIGFIQCVTMLALQAWINSAIIADGTRGFFLLARYI